jgi:rubrerythrin
MSNETKKEIQEIRKIIDVAAIAIPKERDARKMYLAAAAQAPGDLSRKIFEELAAQEEQHAARLQGLIAMLEARLEELEAGK